jgi:hypothetical protein
MTTNLAASIQDTGDLNRWFDQRFERKMAEREAPRTPSKTIIATKGTLDMAYSPFMLASSAGAASFLPTALKADVNLFV